MAIIELKNVRKVYKLGKHEIVALEQINLEIQQQDFIAIMGPSGSGKSTLLNIIGCLDRLTSGTYLLEGEEISTLDDDKLSEIRNKKIGFVFQAFNLLNRLSALENVMLPFLYSSTKVNFAKVKEQAICALKEVGLAHRVAHKPPELSIGEQQRVAIARAIINNPAIILADEPTGNLDSKTAQEIMQIFSQLNNAGKTILLVTHNEKIAEFAKIRLYLKDGVIIKSN